MLLPSLYKLSSLPIATAPREFSSIKTSLPIAIAWADFTDILIPIADDWLASLETSDLPPNTYESTAFAFVSLPIAILLTPLANAVSPIATLVLPIALALSPIATAVSPATTFPPIPTA